MIKSNCVTNIKNKNGVYVRVREIKSHKITEVVKKMCIDANINLGEDVVCAIHNNLEKEESELGKNILHVLLENIQVANEKKYQSVKILVWQCFL